MIPKDELFHMRDYERIWQKYCGFLDLSIKDFMEIQEYLLLEEIELISPSPIGQKIMKGATPKTVKEFREQVPFTAYDDYAPYIGNCQEDMLPEKPYCWIRTSGRASSIKWIPYSRRAIERFGAFGVTVIILACTTKKGEVNIREGMRILYNVPPAPFVSGVMAQVSPEIIGAHSILHPDKYAQQDFETRIRDGFKIGMRTGINLIGSLTSVLIRMGQSFTEGSTKVKFNVRMLHPQVMWRLLKAYIRSKREGRPLLPKDLWHLDGLVCYGMDTALYKEQLQYYWGKEPLECFASSESGGMATQTWNRNWNGMTFLPASCFLEFIPEDEWLKSKEDKTYKPSTVLLDEVKAGEHYEIVISSFYGMPFLRYRLGDLIKIAASEDKEAGIKLPQMIFESRADDLIDVVGFTRLHEKTVWQAINNTGIKYVDWTLQKERIDGEPILHLYIELSQEHDVAELEKSLQQEMVDLDSDYRDLEGMLRIRPLKVTPLAAGSFQRYQEEMKRQGADLARLKPPHMNASDTTMKTLLNLN